MLKNLYKKVVNLTSNEDGQTIVEYAILLALIVLVALAAVTDLGHIVSKVFQKVADALDAIV